MTLHLFISAFQRPSLLHMFAIFFLGGGGWMLGWWLGTVIERYAIFDVFSLLVSVSIQFKGKLKG